MKTIFSLIILSMLALIGHTQETIIFSGKIEKADYNAKKTRFDCSGKVKDAEIIIYDGNQVTERINASKKGRFSVFLQADFIYKIEFISNGYVSKSVQIDTRNLPVAYLGEDRNINSDIRLFERVAGVNFSQYEKLPVAKCAYSRQYERLTWEMGYAEQTYSTFLNMVNSKNGKRSNYGVKRTVKISDETITEEESDYNKESEWLDSFLQNILAKL